MTSGNATLLVAISIAITSMLAAICGPLLLATLSNKHRRRERLEDYERQDAVAAQAAEAARLLLEAQSESIARTDEVARVARETAAATDSKLDVIHTLVNSQLTTALQNEMRELVHSRAMMLELIELKKANGLQPTHDTLDELGLAKARIAELQTVIEERAAQQQLAERQAQS